MKASLRLKNWLKVRMDLGGIPYKMLRWIYLKVVFPIQRRSWRKKAGAGFDAEENLHMCSLLPKKTLDYIVGRYRPRSWLDVGCGTGAALKYVQRLGVDGWGLENSALAIRESGIAERITRVDLTSPYDLGREFDLVWCYEVAEHLPESAADGLLETICRHGSTVLISAAVPGQGGEGHVNEQPIEYWVKRMRGRGYEVDQETTAEVQQLHELFSGNLVCYKRGRESSHPL